MFIGEFSDASSVIRETLSPWHRIHEQNNAEVSNG